MSPSDAATVTSPKGERRPWMGLAAFTAKTQRYFFGRDAEIADIFVRVREQPLTILYGQSGLGKSSLLGAGLFPKLTVEGWRPAIIRLRYEESDSPLIEQVKSALEGLLAGAGEAAAGAMCTGGETLWERLHHKNLRPASGDSHPPVLIFDQFEEIFTLGQRAERLPEARELFVQLADVIENRPPAALRQGFEEDRRLARNYDFTPSPVRFVLTLREDFLSPLEQWKKVLPSLMRNRMALHLLNGPQALEAVVRPGELDGPPLADAEVGAAIVRFVAKKSGETPLEEIGAVPPLLSLVCERLNASRLAQGLPAITAELVESQSSDILHAFYEESFAGQPDALRHFVEDRMVTEGGHRAPVPRDDAAATLRRAGISDPEAALDGLVIRRLISAEDRGGIPWLEITHDVLAPLVVRSRDDRLERERAEAERRRAEAIEKERRRLHRLVVLFAILSLVAAGGMLFGWWKAKEATSQRDEARYSEGLGWLLRAEVAEERGHRYPDTLLYAAQAIGFEGAGRPEGGGEPLRFIREDRNPEAYQRATQWIAERPAYLPLWSSQNRPDTPAAALAVDGSGRWLALGSAEGVRLFDLTAETDTALPGLSGVTDLAFDPEGRFLAAAAAEGVRVWDVTKGDYAANGPEGSATALAWSPGGDLLAGAAEDGTILLWDNGQGAPERIPGVLSFPASSLTFSPENAFLAAVYPGVGPRVFFPAHKAPAHAWADLDGARAEALDERDREAFLARAALSASVTSVAASPDGRVLAAGTKELERVPKSEEGTAGEEEREHGSVVLWDVAGAAVLGRVSPEQRHAGAVTAVAFRGDGRQVASGSEDGTIKLWNLDPSGRALTLVVTLTGHLGPVTRVSYSPGENILASAGTDGSAKLWNVSGQKVKTPDLFAYVEDGWYGFDPEARWGSGSGFANLPAETVAAEWRGKEPESPAEALIADAREAVAEKRWRRVNLREIQLSRLGAELPEELREAREAALTTEGENAGDGSTNGEGMTLAWCPPTGPEGFQMGESDNPGAYLRHQVILSHGFWLGAYEVTQAQYLAVMGTNPSTYKSSGPNAPVENLSWDEAMEFCRKLTDRERARGAIPAGWEYTLPTEAQWEYACRAGTGFVYSFGNDEGELYKYGNYNDASGGFANADRDHDDGYEYTAPVGSYPPNSWNLYDMHGNVYEWCRDSMDLGDAAYPEGPVTDPLGTQGAIRVYRGGGFNYTAAFCRSASRFANPPVNRSNGLGLRPALVPSSPSVPEAARDGGQGR